MKRSPILRAMPLGQLSTTLTSSPLVCIHTNEVWKREQGSVFIHTPMNVAYLVDDNRRDQILCWISALSEGEIDIIESGLPCTVCCREVREIWKAARNS